MPLRDHFHSPLDDVTSWEGFHGGWPMMIVLELTRNLPAQYVAAPRVHLGALVEIVIAAFENDTAVSPPWQGGDESEGGVATALWVPTKPTMVRSTDLPDASEYEVRVYDATRGRRLVAAIEIVSPSNKDRPEHRRIFAAKCAALLQQQVSVAIIDLVTIRRFNLYAELLELIGQKADPALRPDAAPLYAVSCRYIKTNDWQLETWFHPLEIGQPLPTLPVWLSDSFAVPLNLESCYEETCRALRIP
jgi:hypothetical protein